LGDTRAGLALDGSLVSSGACGIAVVLVGIELCALALELADSFVEDAFDFFFFFFRFFFEDEALVVELPEVAALFVSLTAVVAVAVAVVVHDAG